MDYNDADFGRDDVLRIRALLAKLRFAFSVEQAVEGEHAKTKHEIDRVPHHSDALVRLAHRIGPVREYIKDSEVCFEEFEILFHLYTSPRFMYNILILVLHVLDLRTYLNSCFTCKLLLD